MYTGMSVHWKTKLQTTGVIYGPQKYDIVLAAAICDTPAKAFLMNVKGHTGYFGCDRCTQEWVFTERRKTFPEMNACLRTDESFRAMSNEDHHLGQSQFMSLSVGIVSNFPLDYMHLICLKWCYKKIDVFVDWSPLATRLGTQTIRELSEPLITESPGTTWVCSKASLINWIGRLEGNRTM